jgi:hypothetical protein
MDNGPFYCCQNGNCSCEASYPADWLVVFKGTVWCEGCLEREHNFEDYDGKTTPFVPEQTKRILELERILTAAVDCGMVPISSAKDGGAASHSLQVKVADLIRDVLVEKK